MSIFEEQKRAVADMLDYLLRVQVLKPLENDRFLLDIYPDAFRKAKVTCDDVDEIIYWMKGEGIITIEHRSDPDDYPEEVAANDGVPVPAFKVIVDQYGKDSIARLMTGAAVATKGYKFIPSNGQLFFDGKKIYKFNISASTGKIFEILWGRSSLASRGSVKKIGIALKDFSNITDDKKILIKQKFLDINKAFAKKKPPVRLKISINGDKAFLEELEKGKD